MAGKVEAMTIMEIGTSHVDIEVESIANVLRQFLALGLIAPEMVLRQSSNQQGMSTLSQRCFEVAGRCKIQWPPTFQKDFFE